MGQFILWSIIIYFLVRFTVNFLVPVFRITRKMKQQVRDFNQNGHSDGQYHHSNGQSSQTQSRSKTPKTGDYIDFEEVK